MAGIGAIAGILGSVVSAMGTIAAANAQQRQADAEANKLEYEAKVQRQRAMEERAVAQRKSMEKRKEESLAQSQLQARAAASGGGATDPTVLNLAGGIARKGEYDALLYMAEGENRGRAREDQAKLNEWSANEVRAQASEAADAAFFKAGATILGGGFSTFGKYSSPFSPSPGNDYWSQAYA